MQAKDSDHSSAISSAIHNGPDPHSFALSVGVGSFMQSCEGEVVDEFPDNETAIQLLMASCHIPGICGVLPKNVGGKLLSCIPSRLSRLLRSNARASVFFSRGGTTTME